MPYSETVMLSLGSNIGPRKRRIRDAIQRISNSILTNVQASALYETEPVGFTDQPVFINVVIIGETELSPIDLHEACKGLELAQGRVHRERWHEREIDIDVILFGDEVVETKELSIPHPRMHERRFVLVPAAEIARTMVDPLTGCSMEELLIICQDKSGVDQAGTLHL